MHDRKVSFGCVVATLMWVATVGFIVTGTVVGMLAHGGALPLVLGLLSTGLMLSAAAATATIRQYVVTNQEILRNAFDLGRDSVTELPVQRRPVRA